MRSSKVDCMVHISKEIAAAINSTLKDRDLSERWLADRIGVPRATLRRSLKGIRPFPIEEIVAACVELGIDPAKLINEATEPFTKAAA